MNRIEALSTPERKRHLALNSLGFLQIVLFVHTLQIGVGVFSLPRVVVEQAGHNGWMAPVFAGLATQINLWIIFALLRRFGDLSLYEILTVLFGKWIGTLLGGLFALYCTISAALVSRTYVEVVQSWLFPTTSTNMFYLLLLLPCTYAATGGIRVLGRFAIMTFFATLWIIFLLLEPMRDLQFDYYRPLWDTSARQMLNATWKVSASVIGFELILLIYPFVQNKKKALPATSLGTWGTALLYTVTCAVAVGFYSESQLVSILTPSLHMAQVVELPLIERIEHIEIASWSFQIVITVAGYLWGAGRFVHTLRTKKRFQETTGIYIFLPILFAIGVWPRDFFLVSIYEEMLGTIGSVVSFGLPPLLLAAAWISGKRADNADQRDPAEEANAS